MIDWQSVLSWLPSCAALASIAVAFRLPKELHAIRDYLLSRTWVYLGCVLIYFGVGLWQLIGLHHVVGALTVFWGGIWLALAKSYMRRATEITATIAEIDALFAEQRKHLFHYLRDDTD